MVSVVGVWGSRTPQVEQRNAMVYGPLQAPIVVVVFGREGGLDPLLDGFKGKPKGKPSYCGASFELFAHLDGLVVC